MENDQFHIAYCLVHERLYPVKLFKRPTRCSEPDYIHPDPDNGSINDQGCHGPFVFNEPPEPLTEEEWEMILEKESDRYAS